MLLIVTFASFASLVTGIFNICESCRNRLFNHHHCHYCYPAHEWSYSCWAWFCWCLGNPRVRKDPSHCLAWFDTQSRPQECAGIQANTCAMSVRPNTKDLPQAIRWVYKMDMRASRSIYTGLSESSARHVHFGKCKPGTIDEYCDHSNEQPRVIDDAFTLVMNPFPCVLLRMKRRTSTTSATGTAQAIKIGMTKGGTCGSVWSEK